MEIATVILDALDNHHPSLHFTRAGTDREHLLEARFDVPSWEALANGLRPDAEDSVSEPGVPRHGWQCKAMRPVNERFLEGVVQPRLLDASRALLHKQRGPFASLPFTSFPSAPHARFDPQPFRVLLLRRLWLPLPLSSRSCRCGRPLDSSGHHRAACAVAGVLGSRRFALKSAAAAGKQAAVCPRMSESRTRIWRRRTRWTTAGSKLWLTGCRSSMVPNSPWTRHWSHHCAGMGPRTLDAPTWRCSPGHSKASQRVEVP